MLTKYFQLITLFIFLIGASPLTSQNISGTVVDEFNKPLENVYIHNSTKAHSHSNTQGYFTIPIENKLDTLFISSLGYESVILAVDEVNSSNVVSIVMKETTFLMEQVQVTAKTRANNDLAKIDIINRPVRSSQELLTRMPGLFIAQHAGGGKAEQIFLRGFDLDHGTDINISVDGMPVNMVSHAHGQGYSDLHFIIPETIDNIDFGKGPYAVNQGNFATAGFVNFKLKDDIKQSTAGIELGAFYTKRLLTLIDLTPNDNKVFNAYVGSEFLLSDGPFESPQNFNRLNTIGKIVIKPNKLNKIALTLTNFRSKWDASGQIPNRLVENGTINRFGSVDDTEGGSTGRTNIQLAYTKFLDNHTWIKTNAYITKYDFELFSNFTFFLNDSINGDQIKQKENRTIYGLNSSYFKALQFDHMDINLELNVGFRFDDVSESELTHTLNRKTNLERYALGDINETNLFTYLNTEIEKGKFLLNTGVRLDYLKFDYLDLLQPTYSRTVQQKVLTSPKASLFYNHNRIFQTYIKAGVGFHSNDTRTIAGIPYGENLEFVPKAIGGDIGVVWKPFKNIWVNSALWILRSNQEFTYVGDEGIVEPNGKSERKGADLSVRCQVFKGIFMDVDVNYSIPRALEVSAGESDIIPLAPRLTSSGGLSYASKNGFSIGLRYRYIDDRPANDDESITAVGYFITDLNTSYTYRNISLGISVENLFNSEWNEAQFATTSRLLDEPTSVDELHFTPGSPRNMRVIFKYGF